MKICLVSAVRMAASRAKFDEFVDFLLILQCLDWRKRLLEHEIFQKNPARHKMYKCEGGGRAEHQYLPKSLTIRCDSKFLTFKIGDWNKNNDQIYGPKVVRGVLWDAQMDISRGWPTSSAC